MGVFIALTPTVGIQMILVAVIGTLIKANRIIGFILVWISNPVTIIPMYYGYYWVGGKLLALQVLTFNTFSDRISEIIATTEQFGYLVLLKYVGYEYALPTWIGSVLIALLVSAPLYPLTLYALSRYREKNGSEEGVGDHQAISSKSPTLDDTKLIHEIPLREELKEPAKSPSSSCHNHYLGPVKKEK